MTHIRPDAETAREAARRSTGKFGTQPHADSGIVDMPSPERTMATADGIQVTVTPGLIDEEARALYLNGQCLALAVELARSSNSAGVPAGVAVLTYTDDNFDGRAVQHCWATIGDRWYDIDGETDRQTVEDSLANGEFSDAGDDDYTAWYEYGPDELDECTSEASDWLGEQDHDLASTFARAVWTGAPR